MRLPVTSVVRNQECHCPFFIPRASCSTRLQREREQQLCLGGGGVGVELIRDEKFSNRHGVKQPFSNRRTWPAASVTCEFVSNVRSQASAETN